MNANKGLKNISWGLISQIVTIGLGVIIPRLVLVNLGSEANGLLNSVSSVLTYMSLLEAGVGTATLQALYRPFADDDKAAVNQIMAATNYFYRRTGTIYLAIVVLLSVGYTAVVHTAIPKLYVFLVVLLAGMSGVLGYFFQGKFKIFLAAEGKSYISTNITTLTTVGVSVTKAAVLIAGANVVLIQSVYFVFNLLQVIVFTAYMHKHYAWIDFSVKPDFEAIAQKNAVLVHQITELIFNNTDVIILTAFTTLKTVSVYSMYAMIYGMVKSVTVTMSDGFLYSLGQTYQDKEKFQRLHNIYEVYNMAFTFAVFCIAFVLMLPFLTLYTAGIADINYIDPAVSALFVTFYLMANGRKSSQVVINIAQHFEKTKWRSVAEAVINLTVSLLLTARYGIYGVLWGTIAALLYRTNDVILYAAKLMQRSPLITYKRWLINLMLFLAIAFGAARITARLALSSYFALSLYGIALSVTVIPIFIVVASITEPETAAHALGMTKDIFARKINRRS